VADGARHHVFSSFPPYGSTVKFVWLVAVPAGAVTTIGPVVAPLGTVATISVLGYSCVNFADLPLNVTVVGSWSFVPWIFTFNANRAAVRGEGADSGRHSFTCKAEIAVGGRRPGSAAANGFGLIVVQPPPHRSETC